MPRHIVHKFFLVPSVITLISWLFFVMSGAILGCIIYFSNSLLESKALLFSVACILLFFTSVTLICVKYILQKENKIRSEYEEKLFYEATVDSLTKVFNRRYFIKVGKKIFRKSKLNKHPFSVLVLDLDYFKKINDKYGHATGDLALKHFAHICDQSLHHTDIMGRIGGEEFAIILPRTNLEEASKVADKIRALVMDSPLHVDQNTITMTVSIGVAEHNNQESFKALLSNADQALYQVKDSGRNRVFVYATESL